jgi:hypothetical protein
MKRGGTIILIVLLFIAVALIGVLFENLKDLVTYKQCMNQPISELTNQCKGVIYGNI